MGKLFLAILVWFWVIPTKVVGESIQLPLDPIEPKTPTRTVQESEHELRRRELKRRKKSDEDATKAVQFRDETVRKALYGKNYAYRFSLGVSLNLAKVNTRGDHRSHYTTGINHGILGLYRFGEHGFEPFKLYYVTGFRADYINGTAKYRSTFGRYSFSYYGPLVGLISVGERFTESSQRDTAITTGPLRRRQILQVRWGWFMIFGMAMQNRFISSEESTDQVEKDLNTTKQAVKDGSGLWVEGGLFSLVLGAVGINCTLGHLQGEGKNFSWIGLGVSAWY